MSTLKMAFHNTTGRRMVEIWDDYDRFVGAIYPTEDGSNGVHIVSSHFEGEPTFCAGKLPQPPGYVVRFKKPY